MFVAHGHLMLGGERHLRSVVDENLMGCMSQRWSSYSITRFQQFGSDPQCGHSHDKLQMAATTLRVLTRCFLNADEQKCAKRARMLAYLDRQAQVIKVKSISTWWLECGALPQKNRKPWAG